MFAIPRDGKTYVGTTDTNYKGAIHAPRMTIDDRDYILNATNYMFPSLHLTEADVEASWAGLRPLIHEEGKDPSEISRKDEIFVSESGLITIAGGKLTGYRKMAESIVDLVLKQLYGSQSIPKTTTDKVALSGGDVGGSVRFESYVTEKTVEGQELGLSKQEASKVVKRYGTNSEFIFKMMKEDGEEAKAFDLSLEVYATLRYAIEHEMAVTLTDYFNRRTGSLLFDIDWVERWKEPVKRYMATKLEWSNAEQEKYEKELNQSIKEAVLPLLGE